MTIRTTLAVLGALIVCGPWNLAIATPPGVEQQLTLTGGEGISIHGDRVAVGQMVDGGSGSVAVFHRDAAGWFLDTTIYPLDVAPGERFGSDVALWGSWMAVASGFKQPAAVHLYEFRDGAWIPRQRIVTSRAGGWISPVSMRGRMLVVGSPGDGAVHVYRLKSGVWIEDGNLEPDPASGDMFGRSVAVAGPKRIVVASSKAAYVFERRRAKDPWAAQAWLTDHGRASTVAADADVVVVSGYPDNHAQVFRYTRGTWASEGALLGNDSGANDGFAATAAVDGDRIAVSAPWQGGNRGAVYVFAGTNGRWRQEAKLTTDGYSRQIGMALAVDGSTVAVGSWGSGAWSFEQ